MAQNLSKAMILHTVGVQVGFRVYPAQHVVHFGSAWSAVWGLGFGTSSRFLV